VELEARHAHAEPGPLALPRGRPYGYALELGWRLAGSGDVTHQTPLEFSTQ